MYTVKPVLMHGYLYSETTCIKRPLCDVPKVFAQYILTCIQRPPLYNKGVDKGGGGGGLGGLQPPHFFETVVLAIVREY